MQVRQSLIDFVLQANTCFIGGMYFPFSPGHMLSELDNFLRMRHLGEVPGSRPYLGVYKPSIVNLPVHLNAAFPSIFGRTTGVQLLEDEALFQESLELQLVLPKCSVDVGLSHFKIALPAGCDHREAKLMEGGGPRSPFWVISQRMLAEANMSWYRRRFESKDFQPWHAVAPLAPELAEFIGGNPSNIALLHARYVNRAGADNAGVAPAAEDLLPTIYHLRERGYTVVKLGVEICPGEWVRAGVVDYSASPHRSFFNDLCLIGVAKLAIYNGTGLCTLSDVLGTPMVSYGHWHLPWMPQSERSVVIPALMRSKETGRVLRFSEQINFYRQSSELWEPGNAINFPNATHAPLAPSAADILAGVTEALTLAGNAIPEPTYLQERFHSLERNGYHRYCQGRVSNAFLERYQDGLDDGVGSGA